MRIQSAHKYLSTCGVLLLPIFAWNVVFPRFLPPEFAPEEFWHDIPYFLGTVENSLRLFVFTLPFFMPLSISSSMQRAGLGIFVGGCT